MIFGDVVGLSLLCYCVLQLGSCYNRIALTVVCDAFCLFSGASAFCNSVVVSHVGTSSSRSLLHAFAVYMCLGVLQLGVFHCLWIAASRKLETLVCTLQTRVAKRNGISVVEKVIERLLKFLLVPCRARVQIDRQNRQIKLFCYVLLWRIWIWQLEYNCNVP